MNNSNISVAPNSTNFTTHLGYISSKEDLAQLFTKGDAPYKNAFGDDLANHVTAKDYLNVTLYPVLDEVLNQLITTIEENGEFERYVDMLAER